MRLCDILLENDRIPDRYNRTIAAYGRLIVLRPNDPKLEERLADICVEHREFNVAETHYLEAVKRGNSEWYIQLKMRKYTEYMSERQLNHREMLLQKYLKKK